MKLVNLDDVRHGVRVANISYDIARLLMLHENRINQLYISCLFHDIGKAHVDQKILNKPGKFSRYEKEHIELHPIHSHDEIVSLGYSSEMAKIILYHHENYDGSGYPIGLKKDEIPLESRILKIADVFDALTMDRPYRKRLTINQALDTMKLEKNTFDPEIYSTFLDYLSHRYKSFSKKLSKTETELFSKCSYTADSLFLKSICSYKSTTGCNKKGDGHLTI